MKRKGTSWAIVLVVCLAALLLSGCAWGAPTALGVLALFASLLGLACGAASRPHDDEDEESCGDGVCPEYMTCVDTAEHGDWCLPDADQDGLWDEDDNCPFLENPDQADDDDDGVGDACDVCPGPNTLSPCGAHCCNDADGDGVGGMMALATDPSNDNCPWLENSDQRDRDGDRIGDVCDLDPDDADILSPCGFPDVDSDGDGLSEWGNCGDEPMDACAYVPSDRADDYDGDSTPDICDPDGIPPVPEEQASLEPRQRMMLQELLKRGVLDEATVQLAMSGVSAGSVIG